MGSREPFSVGEWYHCYNRGVDKRNVFETTEDYDRFLKCLYLGNSVEPFRISDISHLTLAETLAQPRAEPLAEVGAFCLMPNHFHLLLKEKTEGGITSFMRKLGTGYTMYFNTKCERVGNLFVKPFRSRHVGDDRYFQHCIHYIHCNPAELFEPGWKRGIVTSASTVVEQLRAYPYSSLGIFDNSVRKLAPILCDSIFDMVEPMIVERMVSDAMNYYAEFESLTR